jgi:hypothetical protein
MSAIELPVNSDAPHYDFSLMLEGRRFKIELRWNERSGAWFLSLYDAADELLAAGRRVVLGADLRGRARDARLPPGPIMAVDSSGRNQDAGRMDLGVRVKLVYLESSGG